MTKEFAPGLALDTGEFIPASDLNAQMTAPPVPTSATWGNWLEPTTVAQRLGDVLQLLCGGKRPPDDVVLAWLDAELGDIGLQHFCAQHGPAWAQGIALIDRAMVAVAQPTEGVDHEHVAVEPQVELAHAVLANGLTAEETFATASCSGLTEQRPAAAYAALPEPLEIDWPELHRQALGCGVEDRGLHNRYECAEYGWQDGVDKCVERVPEQIFDAVQMRAFADATCALRATPAQFARGFEAAKAQFASHGQAPAQSECLTCNDHGAVGNILTAEPCQDCTRKAAPAAAAGPSRDLHPEKCPVTGRPFFMTLDHPELGDVPTYGGPYDSYTIPAPEGEPTDPWHERELRSERYDHDAGWWVEGGEPIPLRIVHEDVLFKLQEDAEATASTTQPAPQQEAQKPAAVVVPCHTPSGKRVALYSAKQDLPIGTQLYTATQPSHQQEESKPHGWLYDWTHSSATGKPDTTYTGFTKDEAHARKHDNCTAVFTKPQPSPAAQGDVLDTLRLDWLDADEGRCVFHLGKSWYTRTSYGLPYRKRASLREAIDASRAAQEHKA